MKLYFRIETQNTSKVIKQDGRQPPVYFASSQFGKDAILKDENVFSSKENSSSYFLIFPMFKFFWFFFVKKNLIIMAEKTFVNDTIRYAF